MTVPSDLVKQFANGNGVTTAFFFTYALLLPGDMEVYVNQTLVSPSLYTVFINTNGLGGSVTFGTPPPGGTNNVLLYRFVDYLQLTQFPNESDFNQVSLEDSVDKLTMECQQLEEGLSRSFQWKLTDPNIPNLELPPYAPCEVIGWDCSSRKLANFSLPSVTTGPTGATGPAGATGATGPSGADGGGPTIICGKEFAAPLIQVNPRVPVVGDMIFFQDICSGEFSYDALPIGAAGHVLGSNGTTPGWVLPPEGPTGPTGPTGPAGPPGATGATGSGGSPPGPANAFVTRKETVTATKTAGSSTTWSFTSPVDSRITFNAGFNGSSNAFNANHSSIPGYSIVSFEGVVGNDTGATLILTPETFQNGTKDIAYSGEDTGDTAHLTLIYLESY